VITEDSPVPEDAPEPAVLTAMKDPPSELSGNLSASDAAKEQHLDDLEGLDQNPLERVKYAPRIRDKVLLTLLHSSDAKAVVALRRDGRVSELVKHFEALASPHAGVELKGAVAPTHRLLAVLFPARNPPIVSTGASLGFSTSYTPPKAPRALSASSADEPAFAAMRKDAEERDIEPGGLQKLMPTLD
jgi:hypothetical protein